MQKGGVWELGTGLAISRTKGWKTLVSLSGRHRQELQTLGMRGKQRSALTAHRSRWKRVKNGTKTSSNEGRSSCPCKDRQRGVRKMWPQHLE